MLRLKVYIWAWKKNLKLKRYLLGLYQNFLPHLMAISGWSSLICHGEWKGNLEPGTFWHFCLKNTSVINYSYFSPSNSLSVFTSLHLSCGLYLTCWLSCMILPGHAFEEAQGLHYVWLQLIHILPSHRPWTHRRLEYAWVSTGNCPVLLSSPPQLWWISRGKEGITNRHMTIALNAAMIPCKLEKELHKYNLCHFKTLNRTSQLFMLCNQVPL